MPEKFNFLRIIVLISIYFLQIYLVHGQSRSFGGLPILSPAKNITYQGNLNHLPEYDHISGIYEKLVEARGDRRLPVPQLHLRNEEAYVASMDYRLTEISLEKKAYDIAKKYGDPAIAFLLAHELIHYYEKHGWRSQYADAVSDLETGKILRAVDDRVANEVQADVLGGFLAYSAGYGIFDKGGDLINDLYKSYKMGDIMKGYPSRPDRISLSRRNAVQISRLADIFEMAGLLTITGKYKEAYLYYGHLLNKYQSREMYNNAGVTCMLAAATLMDPKELLFDMPGVLDLEFSGDSRSASQKEQINKLIQEALNHFETAILMNRNYLAPYINKTSAQLIQAINQSDAELKNIAFKNVLHSLDVEIPEIIKVNPEIDYDNFKDEILVLKSILAFYSGDITIAKQLMQSSSDLGSETAKKNLAILEGVKPSAMEEISHSGISIDGMSAEKFLASNLVSRNQTILSDDHIFRVSDQQTKNYKVLLHEFKGNDQDFGYDLAFVVSKKSFKSPFLEGMTTGTHKTVLLSVLGRPKRVLSHLRGEILYFGDSTIIITDHEGNAEKIIDFKEILKN